MATRRLAFSLSLRLSGRALYGLRPRRGLLLSAALLFRLLAHLLLLLRHLLLPLLHHLLLLHGLLLARGATLRLHL